jgi:hypothetical protein
MENSIKIMTGEKNKFIKECSDGFMTCMKMESASTRIPVELSQFANFVNDDLDNSDVSDDENDILDDENEL